MISELAIADQIATRTRWSAMPGEAQIIARVSRYEMDFRIVESSSQAEDLAKRHLNPGFEAAQRGYA
jgi:hypothetical protein